MKIRSLVVFGLFLALASVVFWKRQPLQQITLNYFILLDDGPTEEELVDILEDAPDATDAITRMWATEGIPHRSISMNYLRRRPDVITGSWPRIEPMVMEGLVSGDLEVQAAALRTLWRIDAEAACRWAVRMTLDADPGVRRIGLLFLADNTADRRLVQPLLHLLDDTDPAIVAIAAGTLSSGTGLENPIRYGAAPEQIDVGRRMWREWWKQTASQFPPPLEPVETLSLNSAALPAPDMAMQTIDGTEIDLEQFRGKIVLLNFWATWCPPCAQELPALGELARKYPDTLVVLGVNLDGYVAHDSSDRVVGGVRRFIAEHKVDYPVLMDNSGEMARRFGGEVLPTTAWIDAGGIVRRRYTNPRALPGMEQILAELSGAEKSVQ